MANSCKKNFKSSQKSEKKYKSGKIKLRCCFTGCGRNNTTSKITRVQPKVDEAKSPAENLDIWRKETFYRKTLHRKITLDICGIKEDNRNEYRVCENHTTEKIKEKVESDYKGKNLL